MLTDNLTGAVRAAVASGEHGAVVPPLHLSSNFAFPQLDQKGVYDYTRSGNPTRDQLARALADLEGGQGAVVTASGMAAVTLVLQLLRPDDLLVVPHDCYGGCQRAFRTLSQRGAFRLQSVDLTHPDSSSRIEQLQPRMVWVETPSNPLLRVTDLGRTAETCRRLGALLVADNTFLSPALQRPLALGADLVLHSTTKYLNGHSDVVGGVVVAGSAELAEELDWWSNCLGLSGAPFDSFLTLRGLRTLHVRWAQHLANTTQVVDALLAHPAVSKVHYPGLSTHPGHALACRQQSGFGAIVSFELEGGRPAVAELVAAVRLFTLAESLGGFESLVAHPASMTHASMTAQERARAGIDESLLRLSVGIEHGPDLAGDLVQALDQSMSSLARTG